MKRLIFPALLAAGLCTTPAMAGSPKCGPVQLTPPGTVPGASGQAKYAAPAWPPTTARLETQKSPTRLSTVSLASGAVAVPAPAPAPGKSVATASPSTDSSALTPTQSLFNIYVPAGGDIAAAAKHAKPGSTIHVAPGTYYVSAPGLGSAGMTTTASGTETARIRFVSTEPGKAKIVMTGTGIAWKSKGSYVDIDGFDISGSGRVGILAQGGKERIVNNFIHDLTVSGGCNGTGGAGINAWGELGDAIISSNVVQNIGKQWVAGQNCNTVQGIYVANADNEISGNTISGVASVGINTWHGATDSTIVNNTVFDSKMGIVIGQGDSGMTAEGTENNYVANNVVYRNAHGIAEMGKVGDNNQYIDNDVKNNGVNWKVKGKRSDG